MCIHDTIEHLLTRLPHQTLTSRIDTMTNAALESNGYYNVPRMGDNWSSHMVEISIHNVFAEGASEEEAIRNWMRVANLYCQASDASNTLNSPHPIPVADMKAACEVIVNHRGPARHPEHERAELLLGVLERTA